MFRLAAQWGLDLYTIADYLDASLSRVRASARRTGAPTNRRLWAVPRRNIRRAFDDGYSIEEIACVYSQSLDRILLILGLANGHLHNYRQSGEDCVAVPGDGGDRRLLAAARATADLPLLREDQAGAPGNSGLPACG